MNKFFSPHNLDSDDIKHDDILSLLRHLKTTPYLYLTSYSVNSLASFLDGYLTLATEYGCAIKNQEIVDEFLEWIGFNYGDKDKYEWSANLLFHSKDEVDAFESFFKLLDKYQSLESMDLCKKEEYLSSDNLQIPTIKKYDRKDSFFEFLEKIEQNPWLLKSRTLNSLCDFISGMAQAKLDFELPNTQTEKHFGEFQEWVGQRYQKLDRPWQKIILLYSQDDRDALDNFWKLQKRFKEDRALQ